MPDFHIEMNKVGTINFARKLMPTETYPEPWEPLENSWHLTSDVALIMDYLTDDPKISMVIQATDMCSAIKIIDDRRKEDIVKGIL